MADRDNEYITIEFEDGSIKKWAVVGVFEAEGREYIALLDDDTEEIFLYRYIQIDEDSYDIDEIETDEEFEMASQVLDEILEEEEKEDD